MTQDSLSAADRASLDGVLDAIIPPSSDGRLPGAGALGLAEKIWNDVADLRPVIGEALDTLGGLTSERGSASMADLSTTDGAAVLEALAEQRPLFMPGLVFHAYVQYYQHDQVVSALGLEARPPHPKGFELETGDLSLLDPVRERGALP